MLRCHEPAKHWLQRKEAKCGKAKAFGILASESARATDHVWRKEQPFDPKKFLTNCNLVVRPSRLHRAGGDACTTMTRPGVGS